MLQTEYCENLSVSEQSGLEVPHSMDVWKCFRKKMFCDMHRPSFSFFEKRAWLGKSDESQKGSYRFVKIDKIFFWRWSGKLGYFRKNPNRKVVIFSGMPIQEFPKNAPSESGKIGFLLFVDILLPLSTMLVHHDSHC